MSSGSVRRLTHSELKKELASLVEQAGLPLDELKRRWETFDLTVEQRDLLAMIEDMEFLLKPDPDILREARARAWDKGYGKGREDGESWHVRVSGRLPHKQSRNPYRG